MASNPMQRKSRISFILGMLAALLIAAVFVMLLMTKIKKLQKEKQDLINSQPILSNVYTVSERIAKGGEIPELKPIAIDSTKVPQNALTSSFFTDDDGNPRTFKALVDIEPNTIITQSMVEEDSEDSESLRRLEYNMLTLPSTLKKETYIDIRLSLASGMDFIVVSKKYVEDCNSSTIWLELGERDMMTLNCAIIDSYIIEGSKIYVVPYSDATQAEVSTTYIPSEQARAVISANGDNNFGSSDYINMIRSHIESGYAGKTDSEKASDVESGFATEEAALKAARSQFLGEIGY